MPVSDTQKNKLLEEQLRIEHKYSLLGTEQYLRNVRNLQEGNGGVTDYASLVYRKYIPKLSERVAHFFSKLHLYRYLEQVSALDPETVAYITLHLLLDEAYEPITVQSASRKIARRLEGEVLIQKHKEASGAYIDKVLSDMGNRKIKSSEHKLKVLRHIATTKNVEHEEFTTTLCMKIGLLLIGMAVNETDLFTKKTVRYGNKSIQKVQYSKELYKWSSRITELVADTKTLKPPCVLPPRDWTSFDDGGYYSPEQTAQTKFVLARTKHHDIYRENFERIPAVVEAVNAIQRTPWQINTFMLEFITNMWQTGSKALPRKEPLEVLPFEGWEGDVKDMPPEVKERFVAWKADARRTYSQEHKRFGQALAVSKVLQLAREFSTYEQIYFPHVCDFRGRVYSTVSGLSPQGADYAKAVLDFSEGKEIGARGIYWLKVHIANTYGYDKASFDERVVWVDKYMPAILLIGEDPSKQDMWEAADKPFQFVRACREMYRVNLYGPTYKSNLPVGMDGSCNGLQHFSAILRDTVGGKATNLIPNDVPQDIYQQVADVLLEKLQKIKTPLSTQCQEFGITRKLAKRPVMTLPYGSTQRTCFQSILEHLEDNDYPEDSVEAAKFLSPLLWASIGEVVSSAVTAMQWLKDACSEIIVQDKPLWWLSPSNFKVIQDKKRSRSVRITCRVYGRLTLVFPEDTDKLDKMKNKNGISPNFIHSIDAAHLVYTVRELSRKGIKHFAVIHDDYGTHAADIDLLQKEIREQFVELHSTDWLKDFMDSYEFVYKTVKLPDRPKLGTLDIEKVRDSKYFFC